VERQKGGVSQFRARLAGPAIVDPSVNGRLKVATQIPQALPPLAPSLQWRVNGPQGGHSFAGRVRLLASVFGLSEADVIADATQVTTWSNARDELLFDIESRYRWWAQTAARYLRNLLFPLGGGPKTADLEVVPPIAARRLTCVHPNPLQRPSPACNGAMWLSL
jgi:hypothetical protein